MKKILVVEDEYYARKSIVKILQESDLDIQVCGEAVKGNEGHRITRRI